MSTVTNQETLQYAIDSGIINLSRIQEEIEMKKRQKILEDHPYDIWESNGYCYTYLPDKTKANGRRQVKRTAKEGKSARNRIEDVIVDYYLNIEKVKREEIKKSQTFREIFKQWIKYKAGHTNGTEYTRRISADWKKYYEDDEIANMPITELSTLYLDNWVHDTIKKNKMYQKQFDNMCIILREGLEYGVTLHILQSNPFDEVKVHRKMLRSAPRPKDETQVFSVEETPEIKSFCLKRFEETGVTTWLGVALNYSLGLRVGELCALRVDDFYNDYSYVYIHSQEVSLHKTEDGITYEAVGYEVEDYTKSEKGTRDIYVPDSAQEIVKTIIKTNKKNGYWTNEFLFLRDGERTPSYCFAYCLRKACGKKKVIPKSIHKIRKTYISALCDGGININEVSRLAGHADKTTTLKSYVFNRRTRKQTNEAIELALNA